MKFNKSESYDEEKAQEGAAILKWLLKAVIFVISIGLVVYFSDGGIGIGSLIGGVFFALLMRYILSAKDED